jgi:hypothetical protein
MNLTELQAKIVRKLNRRDYTTTDLDDATDLAILRAQRLLRTPASEATATYTWADGDTKFAIPGDYLKMISLSVDGGDPLDRVALKKAREFAQATQNPGDTPMVLTGVPKMFARDGAFFLIAPQPSVGQIVTINYLANFATLANGTDTNWLSLIGPDIIIYGALSELGLTFTDPRQPVWEKTFVTAIEDLNNQAAEDELTNAQVSPAYNLQDGWNVEAYW